MLYDMELKNEPFNSIKKGQKKVEMRLYDEKRKLLKIGDCIEFTNISNNEKIKVEIINLCVFANFDELYSFFNKTDLGYEENEMAIPRDMEKYYSKEEQKMSGVVGIVIKLI